MGSASSAFVMPMMLPTPHIKGGNTVVINDQRTNRFHKTSLNTSQNNLKDLHGRRRRRRGPNFSVSPPPSARLSPVSMANSSERNNAQRNRGETPQKKVCFGITTNIVNTNNMNNNIIKSSAIPTISPRRSSNYTFPSSKRSSRSMSPRRLPSANTYRLIVRQLLNAVHAGRSLFGRKISKLSEFFDVMDQDSNGMVSRDEFHRCVRRLGIGLTNDQVDGVLAVLDEDHSGRLDKIEFLRALRMEVREEKRGNLPYPSPRTSPTIDEINEGTNYNDNDINYSSRSHLQSRNDAAKGRVTIPQTVRWVDPIERPPKPDSPWRNTLRRGAPTVENPIIQSPQRNNRIPRQRSNVLNKKANSNQLGNERKKDETKEN